MDPNHTCGKLPGDPLANQEARMQLRFGARILAVTLFVGALSLQAALAEARPLGATVAPPAPRAAPQSPSAESIRCGVVLDAVCRIICPNCLLAADGSTKASVAGPAFMCVRELQEVCALVGKVLCVHPCYTPTPQGTVPKISAALKP